MRAPDVPIGVPSDVLERRPDVAAAERAMAAANAQIGVANAAFYPSISLGLSYGQESRRPNTLFDAPSLVWSSGLSVLQPLFDGGRIRGGYDAAKAGYALALANHPRVGPPPMQGAEDGLLGPAPPRRPSEQGHLPRQDGPPHLELVNRAPP